MAACNFNVTMPAIDEQMDDGRVAMETFIVSVGVYMVAVILMSTLIMSTLVFAGKRLHDRMFWKVIGSRTRFFDSNPVGEYILRYAVRWKKTTITTIFFVF